jgi:putative peptidoglycan lipid II flippase
LGSQVPSLLRAGFGFRPRVDWRHPGLARILRTMAPAVLGAAAVQINVMVNTNFASSITDASGRVIDGPVSWLSYAFRFMQLPLGLFGVAIGSATLPAVSRSAALGRLEEFGETVRRSLAMVLLLTLPASVGLAVLGGSMIGVVYQSGRFGAQDTRQTALALAGYAVGLAGYAAIKVLAPAFYALGNVRTPVLVSLASMAVNFVAAASLVKAAEFGHVGLALSTSATALFGAAALYGALRARVPAAGGGGLGASVVKTAAASAVMGAACAASSRALHGWLGASRAGDVADVAISIPLGAAVFYALARLLRVPELGAVRRALAGGG